VTKVENNRGVVLGVDDAGAPSRPHRGRVAGGGRAAGIHPSGSTRSG